MSGLASFKCALRSPRIMVGPLDSRALISDALSVPYLMSGCSTPMLLQIVNLSSLRLAPQCFAFRLVIFLLRFWNSVYFTGIKFCAGYIASQLTIIGRTSQTLCSDGQLL